MQAEQTDLPTEKGKLNHQVKTLSQSLEKSTLFQSELKLWKSSIGSYAFYWEEYFSKQHDPCLIIGQDNLQCYKPHAHLILRGQKGDSPFDLLRIIAAALTCQANIELSLEDEILNQQLQEMNLSHFLSVKQETDEAFIQRLSKDKIKRVRMLHMPSALLQTALNQAGCQLNIGNVMANGRLELLHLLREVSVSRDYHRYGNLGARENEKRHPLPGNPEQQQFSPCEDCFCS